jgi:hypothetical protein
MSFWRHVLTSSPFRWMAAIFLLALIFLWPLVFHPDWIPMTGVYQNTDYLVTHLPYARYIHAQWSAQGHPPLWNSSILSGMPLVADPLSGYFYFPNWLTYLFPTTFVFNLLFVFHIAWTGLGLFLFLRSDGLNPLPALFGAVAWMGTPKLIGYLGGGQVSSLFALAWYPWLLLALDDLICSPRVRSAVLAAGVLALIVLIDIRWGFIAALLALAFLTTRFPYRKVTFRRTAELWLLFAVFVVLCTAVLSLPLSELMTRSERAGLTLAERSAYSLGGAQILALFTPQPGIVAELITYLGIPVILLAGLGFFQRSARFWVGLVAFAALFSLGSNGPLFPWLTSLLPGAGWMRVPSRFWFLVALGAVILSARGLDELIHGIDRPRFVRWFHRISFSLGLFAVLSGIGFALFFPPLPDGILHFAVITPLTLLLMNLVLHRSGRVWVGSLFLLLVIDLLWINASYLRSVPFDSQSTAADWLDAHPGLFRVYSLSSGVILSPHLQVIEGVNPTHLQNYSRYMIQVSGIDVGGYSVSVPGMYVNEDSSQEQIEAAASPDGERLGILNVKYILSDFSLNGFGGTIQRFGSLRVYENPYARERAWMDSSGTVEVVSWSPDAILARVETGAGGRVVFSEIDYPGWQATVDGKPVKVEAIYGLLRAVSVLPGRHEVKLIYVPMRFYLGLGISILGWVGLILIVGTDAKTLLARARSFLS